MTRDDEMADCFEALDLDAATFGHRDHVAAAHAMLRRYPFVEATSRTLDTLHRLTVRERAESMFNTTITVAFMALIAERMDAAPDEPFAAFAERCPELLCSTLLQRFYSPERLTSPLARRLFVMPDRIA